MSEPAPRPWTVIKLLGQNERVEAVFVADATSRAIARLVGEDGAEDNAQLIVDSVNECSRLAEAGLKVPDFRLVIRAAAERDAAIEERDRLREALNRACSIDQVDTNDLRELARRCIDLDIYGGGLLERLLGDIDFARAALASLSPTSSAPTSTT